MKLNRSILLISLISVFLILSLGAVSAAGDIEDQFLSDNSGDMAIDDNGDINDFSTDIKDTNVLSQGEDADIYADESEGDGDSTDDDPVDTTIESEDKEYKYGDNITIPVSVKDNESNPIPIVKENLNVSNGNDELNFTLDNESNIILNQLDVGEYTIHIKFIGNATYNPSETDVNLNITQVNTTIDALDTKVKVGSLIYINCTIKDEFNNTITYKKANLKVYYGEELVNFTVSNGRLRILNLTDIGEYLLTIKFNGTDNYNLSEAVVKLCILANNTMAVNGTIHVNNHTKNATIPFNLTNTNITTTYDEETGENVTNVNVTNVTVTKEDLKLILTYFNGTDNITEEITDFELIGDVGNYSISFVTEDYLKLNHSSLNIIFKNDTVEEVDKNVTLIANINLKIIPQTVAADYQSGNFTFKLVDADTGDVLPNTIVSIRGVYFYIFKNNSSSIYPYYNFTSDENGIIFVDNINMNSGYDFSSFIYNFTSLQAGKYNFTFQNATEDLLIDQIVQITVNPVKVKIVASNYKQEVDSGVKYVFKLVNANTNKVIKLTPMQFKVKIGNKYTTFNTTTNMSGQSAFNINLGAGTYPVTIVTNSANVVKTSVNKTLTIVKKKGLLSASNRTIQFGSGATAIIRFTDKNTKKAVVGGIVKVRLYTTAKKYLDLAFLTNKTGYVKFSAALAVGKHKMIISSGDSKYTASSITRYCTVKKANGKFTVPKSSAYYNAGKIYSIKLTNTKNKYAMYGAKVNIKVYISKNRFYNYTGTTDGNGKVNLKVSYKPGTYKVVASDIDAGYDAKSVTGQIKVLKHPIKMSPVSLKVKKGKNLKIKVVSKSNKKVLSKVSLKIKVYTGKKYKTYTKKTNKNGLISIKLTQKVGKHKIEINNVATKLYKAGKVTKTITITK